MRLALAAGVVLSHLAALAAAHAAGNVEEPLWLSAGGAEPPRLYLFWQGPDPRVESYATTIRTVRPDFYQFGATPHQSMRPAPEAEREGLWSYEAGQVQFEEPTGPIFFTTEAYRERMEQAQSEAAYITRELGAWAVAPYVCAVKMNGNAERRYGFWAAYDHWEELEPFGYGPKPAADPWEWVVLRADYNAKSIWSFYKPAKDGSTTHSACPNSPFSDYLANFVRLTAENGARGIFVDNPGTNCICPYCQEAWQAYLHERFSPEQMRRYFRVERYEDATMYQDPFRVETVRFWSRSVGRHLARMKAAGESVWGEGNFWVMPNGTAVQYEPIATGGNVVEWARAGGFQLGSYENIRHHWGVQPRRLTGDLRFNEMRDLIPGHKLMRGLASTEAWAAPLRACLSDPGFRNLHTAEALAFDGMMCDGGYPHQVSVEQRLPLYEFTRHFQGLLRTGDEVAEVGVVAMTNELCWEPADPVREFALVTDWLSEARVQWRALPDDAINAAELAGLRAVLVPNQRMLDDAEVATLRAYAEGGGTLILSGECGTRYLCGAGRDQPAFADLLPEVTGAQPWAVAACGQGRVAWCPRGFADVDVPAGYTGADTRASQPARGLIRETNRATFLQCVNAAADGALSSILPPGPPAVRIASRWFREGDAATMTVHLANYDLRVDTVLQSYYIVPVTPSVIRPVQGVRVAAPVPAGWHATGVTWIRYPDPELRREPLEFTALRDGVAFTVPAVEYYAMAAVELAPGAADAAQSLADLRGAATSTEGTLPMLERDTQSANWRPAAEGEPADLSRPLHVAPGVPIIASAQAGSPLELRLHGAEGAGEPVVWDPYTLGDEWTIAGGAGVWLRFWIVAPSGAIEASGAVPAGRDTRLSLTARETGLYVLMTEPGAGSLTVSSPSRYFMALAQPLTFSEPGDRLYFRVPEGVAEIKLVPRTTGLAYDCRWQVFDADGNVVVDREDVNVHGKIDTIPVPTGQAGRVWSFLVTSEKRPVVSVELMTPLAGFVATDPTRLAVFGE